jgi:hypothetical protein
MVNRRQMNARRHAFLRRRLRSITNHSMADLLSQDTWPELDNDGGPVMLIPRASLPFWSGTEGPDYYRACTVKGYLGVIQVGDEQALVIHDEPASTALLPTHSPASLVIGKWTYGPDEASVASSLCHVRLDQFPRAEVRFAIRSTPQVLISCDWVGTEVGHPPLAQLPPGNYEASTLSLNQPHTFRSSCTGCGRTTLDDTLQSAAEADGGTTSASAQQPATCHPEVPRRI